MDHTASTVLTSLALKSIRSPVCEVRCELQKLLGFQKGLLPALLGLLAASAMPRVSGLSDEQWEKSPRSS